MLFLPFSLNNLLSDNRDILKLAQKCQSFPRLHVYSAFHCTQGISVFIIFDEVKAIFR